MSNQHHHHHHHHDDVKNIKVAFLLNFGFAIIEIIGGIIRENSLKELESLMEIHKNRSIREKILMKAPEFGEIVKKKYE